jgi:hypothetical protein
MKEDAFAHICPHCDKEIVVTVDEIMSMDNADNRYRTKGYDLREEKCPHCKQWFDPNVLDTCSMIEDGEISSNVDYEPTDFDKKQVARFNEKVANGEYPKPWFPR